MVHPVGTIKVLPSHLLAPVIKVNYLNGTLFSIQSSKVDGLSSSANDDVSKTHDCGPPK